MCDCADLPVQQLLVKTMIDSYDSLFAGIEQEELLFMTQTRALQDERQRIIDELRRGSVAFDPTASKRIPFASSDLSNEDGEEKEDREDLSCNQIEQLAAAHKFDKGEDELEAGSGSGTLCPDQLLHRIPGLISLTVTGSRSSRSSRPSGTTTEIKKEDQTKEPCDRELHRVDERDHHGSAGQLQ